MLAAEKKANLTVRNFPATVAELRKRLKLAEGGGTYLFATTLADEKKGTYPLPGYWDKTPTPISFPCTRCTSHVARDVYLIQSRDAHLVHP